MVKVPCGRFTVPPAGLSSRAWMRAVVLAEEDAAACAVAAWAAGAKPATERRTPAVTVDAIAYLAARRSAVRAALLPVWISFVPDISSSEILIGARLDRASVVLTSESELGVIGTVRS